MNMIHHVQHADAEWIPPTRKKNDEITWVAQITFHTSKRWLGGKYREEITVAFEYAAK